VGGLLTAGIAVSKGPAIRILCQQTVSGSFVSLHFEEVGFVKRLALKSELFVLSNSSISNLVD